MQWASLACLYFSCMASVWNSENPLTNKTAIGFSDRGKLKSIPESRGTQKPICTSLYAMFYLFRDEFGLVEKLYT